VFADGDLLLEDSLCAGLTTDQLREQPAGHNSIVWLIWHRARDEDVAINTVLGGTQEVLERTSGSGSSASICARKGQA
jgi:hypothetical protein